MSHNVRVTRTTTTTTTSAFIINSGYMKTWLGIFKIAEVVLGIINVGLIAVNFKSHCYWYNSIAFFLLIACTFLIGTFIYLLSCVVSISTASIISKTAYECIYHAIAAILYLIASLILLVNVSQDNQRSFPEYYAASIIGFIVCVIYGVNAGFGYRSYKQV